MKKIYLFLLVITVCLFLPLSEVRADQWSANQWSNVLASYTNPHAICQYYRSQSSVTIDRESDSECLISVGQVPYIAYTQFYYSGNNWCVRITQEGTIITNNCIPLGNGGQSSSSADNPSQGNQGQTQPAKDTSQDWWTNALAKAKTRTVFRNDIFMADWWLVVPATFTNDIFDPIWRVKVASNFRDDLFNRGWWWLNYKRPVFKFSSSTK